jgi:hypothetical protein
VFPLLDGKASIATKIAERREPLVGGIGSLAAVVLAVKENLRTGPCALKCLVAGDGSRLQTCGFRSKLVVLE